MVGPKQKVHVISFILLIAHAGASLFAPEESVRWIIDCLGEPMADSMTSFLAKNEWSLFQNAQPPSENSPCQLYCWYVSQRGRNVFGCKFLPLSETKCPNVTRRVMREARVLNIPDYPWLINVFMDPIPRLSIGLCGWNIRHFEDGFLTDYPMLEDFFTRLTSVATLSRGMFDHLVQLRSIEISQNPVLSIIEDGIFRNLSHLECLQLSAMQSFGRSADRQIGKDLFTGLRSLSTLIVQSNSVRTVHKRAFKDLTELLYLEFSFSFVRYLHKDVFAYQKKLTHLKMTNNLLESGSLGTLEPLNELEHLVLTDNPFRTLPENMVKRFKRLKMLLIGCEYHWAGRRMPCITLEEKSLATEQTLETISVGCVCDLNPLRLSGINSDILLIHNVTEHTDVQRDTFKGIIRVRMLQLIYCRIRTIAYNAFHGEQFVFLQELALIGNQIATILPGTFEKLSILNKLDLRENQLTRINRRDFANSTFLTELDLSYNKIAEIEKGSFIKLDALTAT